ncbi:hypothetical protein XELAEV_18011810mg [Xenopus laevis]|uniref:Uncharacterized protein n=1 Tax=Xenopus laevis TaxID=8355 RepID=A0A974HXN9_XENLA|nr:hypothetical protein XELAEV_18011810mg [Xenopus laevis]
MVYYQVLGWLLFLSVQNQNPLHTANKKRPLQTYLPSSVPHFTAPAYNMLLPFQLLSHRHPKLGVGREIT